MSLLDKINSPEDLKKLPVESLKNLCGQIRNFLVDRVSKTGGHLASNLGVVELTVALHYCFDSPKDKIIWDVGHQAYVHKILTGRKNKFGTLRQLNGLSGFPKSAESPHDFFDTGHCSTSISQALGVAISRDLKGEEYNVVAVTGDGALTGGLSFEAMNNAGRSNINLMVILNDNEMSISQNVGALSKHLNKIRTSPNYIGAKSDVNRLLRKIPVLGAPTAKFIEKTKDSVKYLLVPGIIFEEMGFKYIGPVDGHNLNELIEVLNRAKKIKGPVFLHVYTKKGKGYKYSEKNPCFYHGIDKFDLKTGKVLKIRSKDAYSDVLGQQLVKLAEKNDKIVAVTAAMSDSTGIYEFQKAYPKRAFDVGIAESHAVTFAGAMAKNGLTPVVAIYSTFLQRSYDQLLHDVCIPNSHVVFAIDRAGVVGADGETHQGLFDISFLSHMPNMTIMAPKNTEEFKTMLDFAIGGTGPFAIRYPKGGASPAALDLGSAEIELGKSETLFAGEKIALVSFGALMDKAYEVYLKLKENGHNPALINARFAKPLDLDMIRSFGDFDHVFTLEDNVRTGGFGQLCLNALNSENVNCRLHIFSLPDEFIPQGQRDEIFDRYNLSTEKIFNKILAKIKS